MAYTQTTELALDKAVPGTNQAFETSVINDNWDKVDDAIIADRADIADIVSGATALTAIDGGAA